MSPVPDKFTMKTSQSLNLSGKSLTELPLEAVENALEARVQAVDLSKNQLTEFPANLDRCNNKTKYFKSRQYLVCSAPRILQESSRNDLRLA